MKLETTIEPTLSDSYQACLIDEYKQLKIRYEKLKEFNTLIEAGQYSSALTPEHSCPASLLLEQQQIMGHYLHLLEVRAKLEGVQLPCVVLVPEQKDGMEVCP